MAGGTWRGDELSKKTSNDVLENHAGMSPSTLMLIQDFLPSPFALRPSHPAGSAMGPEGPDRVLSRLLEVF